MILNVTLDLPSFHVFKRVGKEIKKPHEKQTSVKPRCGVFRVCIFGAKSLPSLPASYAARRAGSFLRSRAASHFMWSIIPALGHTPQININK
jgi:hypothetical protein